MTSSSEKPIHLRPIDAKVERVVLNAFTRETRLAVRTRLRAPWLQLIADLSAVALASADHFSLIIRLRRGSGVAG
jgi:hypothetical protein